MAVGAAGHRKAVAAGVVQRLQVVEVVGIAAVVDLGGVNVLGEETRLAGEVGRLTEGVRMADVGAGGAHVGQVGGDVPVLHLGMGEQIGLVQAVGEELGAVPGPFPAKEHGQADFVALLLRLLVARAEQLDALRPGQVARHGGVAAEEVVGDDDGIVARGLVGARHLGAGGVRAGAALRSVQMRFNGIQLVHGLSPFLS